MSDERFDVDENELNEFLNEALDEKDPTAVSGEYENIIFEFKDSDEVVK